MRKNLLKTHTRAIAATDIRQRLTKFWLDLKKLTKLTFSGRNDNRKVEFESLDASRNKWQTIYNDPTWSFDTVEPECE